MTRYRFSVLAVQQLDQIFRFIARDNFDAAKDWLEQLTDTCRMLADNPGVGRPRPEYGERLRSFPFGRYLIFFRSGRGPLEIVQILHGARDLPSHWDAK